VTKPVAAKPVAAPAALPTPALAEAKEMPAVGAAPAPIDGEIPPPSLQTIVGTTRNGDFIAGLGRSKELVSEMFGTLAAGTLAPKVFEVSDSEGYVVVQLTDRTEADMEDFKEQASALQAALSQAKGVERLQTWLLKSCLRLKDAGSIKANAAMLTTGSDSKQIPYEPCSSLDKTQQ
jgi:hypothetical protein